MESESNSQRSVRPPASPLNRPRTRVDHHPLSRSQPASAAGEHPIQTPVASRSYAASLAQSAARSVLDNTPSSACSDEENAFDQSPSSPGLRSLLQKTVPALPDEDDRKRFIGCLAAVLASSYDYDCSSDGEEDGETTSMSESFAYFDDDDEIQNTLENFENDVGSNSCDSLDGKAVITEKGIGTAEDSGSRSVKETKREYQSETNGKTLKQSRRHLSKSRRKVNPKGKSENEEALARSRHRLRRHELLSNLLVSASEQLFLEKSQARAFLPMLDKLLSPTPESKASVPASTMKQARNRRIPWRRRPSRKSQSAPPTPIPAKIDHVVPEHGVSSFATGSAALSDVTTSDVSPQSVATEPSLNSESPSRSDMQQKKASLTQEIDDDETLRPFLESLSPGAGFRCMLLLLLQHLLHSNNGYDARVRHVLKKLGVIVFIKEMKRDPLDISVQGDFSAKAFLSDDEYVLAATRKYEALEHAIAFRLLQISDQNRKRANRGRRKGQQIDSPDNSPKKGVSRQQIVRGLKIGSAGLVAGTLFAVSGGLAAPAIAAGVAAVAGGAAATAAVVALTSTAAITTIFGVGGGGLAAYKMQRRTQGLTEFQFQRESGSHNSSESDLKAEAELFSTICLSGWLRDKCDFQRPWGVNPSNPPLKNKQEILERFYAIHKPEYIPRCAKILKRWKGQEAELWTYLEETYGTSPSNLFPLSYGPRFQYALTHEQTETVDKIFAELGFSIEDQDGDVNETPGTSQRSTRRASNMEDGHDGTSKSGLRQRLFSRSQKRDANSSQSTRKAERLSSGIATPVTDSFHRSQSDVSQTPGELSTRNTVSSSASSLAESEEDKESAPPKHIATVWDYQSMYGGELYTIRWESKLLQELSDSVEDLALDMMGGATTTLLKQTALSSLLSAVALPYALVSAANMIDGTWTLAIERCEEAGKELARSLLFSRAGHRPVVLVGFSMGARAIYACLKELARFQEKWEEMSEYEATSDVDKILKRMREPASIVEDAILMGLPNHLSLSSWRACRRVVAGRLVNCYSRKDLVLSLMFQFKRLSGGLKPVCGTCAVKVHGVENFDVSDLVSSHQDYCLVTGDILKLVRHGQPLRQPQSDGGDNAASEVD